MTRRRRTARFARLLGIVAALVLLLAGCSAGSAAPEPMAPPARPVTPEGAQLLAVVRFNNFDTGTRPFSTSITEKGTELELQGWIDYAGHLGYAEVTGSFTPQALLWNGATVGVHESAPDAHGNPALPIKDASSTDWVSHPLDGSTSRLDSLLIVLGGLGSDRPENPLLLQQAGAMWLRADTVDGVPVTVFASPPSDNPPGAGDPAITADTSPLRLWVDAAGRLRRAEIRLGAQWQTVDFTDTPGPSLSVAGGGG